MKNRLYNILFFLLFASSLSATDIPLATFDTDSENLVLNTAFWTDNSFDLIPMGIAVNEVRDGINKSGKAMLVKNKVDAQWWPNYNGFKLTQPILITEKNKYLKMMVYREHQTTEMRVAFNCENNNVTDQNVIYFDKVGHTAEWVDVVMDLTAYVGQEFKALAIVHACNWGTIKPTPAAVYMYDEFALSDNPTPRVSTERPNQLGSFEGDEDNIKVGSLWTDHSNDVTPLAIADNIDQSGINKTGKVMAVKNKENASWWPNYNSFELTAPVLITEENKYLKVMVYREQQAANMRFSFNVNDNNETGNNILFEGMLTKTGAWQDVVMDLTPYIGQTFQYLSVVHSCNWDNISVPEATYMYDEFILSDNDQPRSGVHENELTISDFESTAPNMVLIGASNTILEVVENPEKTGVNDSEKVLMIDQTNEDVWWSRVQFFLNTPLKITDQNRYFHVKIKSATNPIAFVSSQLPSEGWVNGTFLRNEWTDCVIDLGEHKGKILTTFDLCTNMLSSLDKVCYLDDLEFNYSATPRIGRESFLDNIASIMTVNDADNNFVGQDPSVSIALDNKTGKEQQFTLIVEVTTDAKIPYHSQNIDVALGIGEKKSVQYELTAPDPGFYRVYVKLKEDVVVRQKNCRVIGYNPNQIDSPTDMQDDFDTFWQAAIQELATVAPAYKVTEKSRTASRIVYDVEMKSIKDVTIKGFLSVPNKAGKFPTVIRSNGYNTAAWVPNRNDDFVEFTYNVRGQGLNPNTYTESWLLSGLQSKETYYYREAFMDALRAVDFVAQRPEVNANLLFAEGGSQGGALAFVMTALDKRIKGIAPTIPFLSDYKDYDAIKHGVNEWDLWPFSDFDAYRVRNNLSADDFFTRMSYFDIKNLAPQITVPILMGVGLQDDICPPHINFAAYNQVSSDEKEYFICKDMGHDVTNDYHVRKDQWYADLLKKLAVGIQSPCADARSLVRVEAISSTIRITNLQSEQARVCIYTLQGKAIAAFVAGNNTIDTSAPAGVYIVQVISGGVTVTSKVVVS